MRCPYCYTKNQMNRSRFRAWDWFLVLFMHRPYRCRVCRRRFFGLIRFRDIVFSSKRTKPDSWEGTEETAGRENPLDGSGNQE